MELHVLSAWMHENPGTVYQNVQPGRDALHYKAT